MGCRLRGHVRAQDERGRERRQAFHEALNASLAAQGVPQLPPQTLEQLRADIQRYGQLRAELAAARLRRRYLLRTARLQQQTSSCNRTALEQAA
jgi:hypothetical protein